LQVVAVDDGSTDGSGQVLDRYAAAHPEMFVVVHQENSGGPAAPCNRGLEHAEGRYVFFLGADDYLGDEALLRLVTAADAWDSDVVFGRMVGVNDRYVYQGVFRRTDSDADPFGKELPFSLSNTKLFRRSMIEARRIRFPLGLRIGSDQPFTLSAMVHARRISVLADYDYYFAVKREKATNISYATSPAARVEDIGRVMDQLAEILPAGERRDAVLRRHFTWELNKLLRPGFLDIDEAEQKPLADAIGALCDRYLTDRIARSLWVSARSRFRLAQAGDLETLRAVIVALRDDVPVPLALEQGTAYAAFPGFRDPAQTHPDAWYEIVSESTWERIVRGFALRSVGWSDGRLRVVASLRVTASSADQVSIVVARLPRGEEPRKARRVSAGTPLDGVEAPVTLSPGEHGGSVVEAWVDPAEHREGPLPYRAEVFLRLRVGGHVYDRQILPQDARQHVDVDGGIRYVARRQGGGLVLVVRRTPQDTSGDQVTTKSTNKE
jgi:hypothetical protein